MAYATETAIANEALFLCGANPITDIDSATDPNAIIVNTVFDAVRDDMLSKHDWAFADVVAELAEDTGVDNYTMYEYAYDLPVDIIRMINLVHYSASNPQYTDAPYLPYMLRANHLYTDEAPCWIRYTKQETDVTQFPHWFGRAFAAALAAEITPRLTADDQDEQKIGMIAAGRFGEAMRMDALERKQYDIGSTPINEVG